MWGSITAPLLLQYLYRKLNPPVIPVLCLYPKYLPYIYIPDTLYDAANTGVSGPLFLDPVSDKLLMLNENDTRLILDGETKVTNFQFSILGW